MGSQEAAPWHRHRAACPALGTAREQPKETAAEPGDSLGEAAGEVLFSLEKKRLNKKLEKGGNKVLSVSHVARRN